MRALVLTGPPAVGKSTIGRGLAERRPRGGFVDVDDVRQFVVHGHAAPWQGDEGVRQQRLGVLNACLVARNLVANDVDTVLADVLSDQTAALYRELLPDVLIVQLVVDRVEAERRAGTRPWHLTPEEFGMLHDQQAGFDDADVRLDVTELSVREAVDHLLPTWLPPTLPTDL